MPYISLDPATAAVAPAINAGQPLTGAGMTLADFRAEVIPALGIRTDIPVDRIDRWINQGYFDLASSLDIETLYSSYSFNTVAGQPMYSLPGSVASTRAVSVVDSASYPTFGGRPLEKMDLNEYRTAKEKVDKPRGYFRNGIILVIYPTPSDAYAVAVDFRIRPLKLTAVTDSPILPEEWHEAIIISALEKGYRRLMEFDKALTMQNELTNLIRRKRDERAEEETGRVVMSSVPGRHRETLRGYTPRSLEDDAV